MAIAILQNAGAGKPGQYKKFDIIENGMEILAPDPGCSLDGAIIDVNVQPEEVQFDAGEINTNGEHTFEAEEGKVFTNLTVKVNVPSAEGDQELIDGSVTAYSIPEGVKEIRDHCFFGCAKLSYVQIPEGVTSIGNSAFSDCESLTSIVIPDSVTSIGDEAFSDCTSIKTYDFTACKDVPDLGDSALEINEGTKIIVPYALYGEWIETDGWTEYKEYIKALGAKSAPDQSKFNIYVDANTLQEIVNYKFLWQSAGVGVGKNEVLYDCNVPFLRIYGDGYSPEAYATVPNVEGTTSGKYLVFAYRIPTSNAEELSWVQIYANTTNEKHDGHGDLIGLNVKQDGNWHVVAIDLEEAIATSSSVLGGTYTSKFNPNADGTYTIGKLRLDWFNQVTSTESYIDVAYVGMCDTLEKARSADPDYTGAEFFADDFVDKIVAQHGENKANKGNDNGMEYAAIKMETVRGENYVILADGADILPNTSKYVGIMYRKAPGSNSEVWIGSEQGYITRGVADYDTPSGWHFLVISFDDKYKDSICRTLRFDFFNNLGEDTLRTIDVAFLKFFATMDEAEYYYQAYVDKYNLNQEET